MADISNIWFNFIWNIILIILHGKIRILWKWNQEIASSYRFLSYSHSAVSYPLDKDLFHTWLWTLRFCVTRYQYNPATLFISSHPFYSSVSMGSIWWCTNSSYLWPGADCHFWKPIFLICLRPWFYPLYMYLFRGFSGKFL